MDSVPMLIISGQARYATTVYASGLKLRTCGIQEFDIINTVKTMTKYCKLVVEPEKIKYYLEKALYYSMNGRKGPCWLDIPLDVQQALIDVDTLEGFSPKNDETVNLSDEKIDFILNKIKTSSKPIIVAGNGIRLAGAHEKFILLLKKLNVPVVTTLSSCDAVDYDNGLYVGKMGITGDRAGNFAVQNSDLLLSFGSRLSFDKIGFNYKSWAPNAYKIVNDIDDQELEKKTICADLKICSDVKYFIERLLDRLGNTSLPAKKEWIDKCSSWKREYPVVLNEYYESKKPNLYAFANELSKQLLSTDNLVVSVGSSRVVLSQAVKIKKGTRFITNVSMAAMGYCLPAGIGVCLASENSHTIIVTGDGSLQMNIQELQTIIHNKFPITIFVINNNGYFSIRQTQKSFFNANYVGVGDASRDLSFPNLKKLSKAYGFKYFKCDKTVNLSKIIELSKNTNYPVLCEIVTSDYVIAPKVTSKLLPDGKFMSAEFDNMYPFIK